MKDKYEGCYIDGYKDHYAVFADNGEKLAEYDTHKDAKEDIAEWEAEVKNESYIPADTLATGYRLQFMRRNFWRMLSRSMSSRKLIRVSTLCLILTLRSLRRLAMNHMISLSGGMI